MSTFNINADLETIEKLHDLAETTEDVHRIPCGAISFDTQNFPQLDCMSLADVGGFAQIGDLVADIAARQLQSVVTYPGDLERAQSDEIEHQFWLIPVSGKQGLYEINDTENDPVDVGFCMQVEHKYLLDKQFNLPLWYATQLAIHKGIEFENLPMTNWLDFQIGDAYAHGLMWRLTDGVGRFPKPLVAQTLDERFWVYE